MGHPKVVAVSSFFISGPNLPKNIADQKTIREDAKLISPINASITSLACAVHEEDERMNTFMYNNLVNVELLKETENNEQSSEVIVDVLETDETVASDDQTTDIERPSLFRNIWRRIIAMFQGNKIDEWTRQNSLCFI